jgi:hypothetical protein
MEVARSDENWTAFESCSILQRSKCRAGRSIDKDETGSVDKTDAAMQGETVAAWLTELKEQSVVCGHGH